MYSPDEEILKKYAEVLVNFALNSGNGMKPGEVVQCIVPDVAKPLLMELYKTIIKSGGHPVVRMLPSGLDPIFYKFANNDQLTFFPKKFIKSRRSSAYFKEQYTLIKFMSKCLFWNL